MPGPEIYMYDTMQTGPPHIRTAKSKSALGSISSGKACARQRPSALRKIPLTSKLARPGASPKVPQNYPIQNCHRRGKETELMRIRRVFGHAPRRLDPPPPGRT
eukprot:742059-Pelagomonas_calceolata.AAC.1